jgi:amino acid transporter
MSEDLRHKVIGFFQIIMINVIALDTVRTLTFSAEYGLSLIFYYLVAAILFFIPSALVSAELGTAWPEKGGLYVWIREAFGFKIALVAIWLNWVYNLAWYPTVMAFIAGTSAYLFDPSLAQNKVYMIVTILGLFWLATYINCHGMRLSSVVSTVGAIVGILFPMLLIITLGIVWLALGNQSQIELSFKALLPSSPFVGRLPYFSNLLFGLLGLEMVATHAGEMKNPKKDYPRALFISVILVLFLLVLSSLSIAIVVPHGELNLVVGALQAFTIFFDAFNIPWMTPIIAVCIILGGLSGVSAWIIGPTKGIQVAGQDGQLPKIFTKKNDHGVPTGALFLQAGIVTLLSLLFIYMPTINSSFFLLSVVTSQLALIVYSILFAASIKLHHYKREVARSFKIPGEHIGIWTVAISGIVISLAAIGVGFILPSNIKIESPLKYEMILILGMVVLAGAPLVISAIAKQKRNGKRKT